MSSKRVNNLHVYPIRGDESLCSKCSSYVCTCIGYLSPKRNKLKSIYCAQLSEYSPEYGPTSLNEVAEETRLPPQNTNATRDSTQSPLDLCTPTDISLELLSDATNLTYQPRRDSVILSPFSQGHTGSPCSASECSLCSPISTLCSDTSSSSLYYSPSTSESPSSPTCTVSPPIQDASPPKYVPLSLTYDSPLSSTSSYRRTNFCRGYSPLSPKSTSTSSTFSHGKYSPPVSPERTPTPSKYASKITDYSPERKFSPKFDFSPDSPTYLKKPPLHIDSSPEYSLPYPQYDDKPKPPSFVDQSPLSPQYTPSTPSYCLFSPQYISPSPEYSPISACYIPSFVSLRDETKSPKFKYEPPNYSPSTPYNSSPVSKYYSVRYPNRSEFATTYISASPTYSPKLQRRHVDSPLMFNGRILQDDIPCICCSPLPSRY